MQISDETRKEKSNICQKCEYRKTLARMGFSIDWMDCPRNCPNDYEHFELLGYDDPRGPELYMKGMEELKSRMGIE